MMLSFAWKEITRRRARTALTVLGIFFSTGLLVAVLSVADLVGNTVNLMFDAAGADIVAQTLVEPGAWTKLRLARHFGPIPTRVLEQIERLEGVEEATGQLQLWVPREATGEMAGEMKMMAVSGIDPKKETVGAIAHRTRDARSGKCCFITNGNFLNERATNTIFLDERYAKPLGLEVGQKIAVGERKLEIVGLGDLMGITRAGQAEAFVHLPVAQELLQNEAERLKASTIVEVPLALTKVMIEEGDVVNLLLIRLKSAGMAERISGQVKRIVAEACGLPVERVKTFTTANVESNVASVSLLAQKTARTLSIIVLAGVILLVIKSAVSSVAERTGEIGILKATGWQDRDVSRLVVIELLIQGLVGGVLGCVAGYAVGFGYSQIATLSLPSSMNPFPCVPVVPAPVELTIPFRIYWPLVLGGMCLAIGVSAVAAYLASRRAAALTPAQAMHRV